MNSEERITRRETEGITIEVPREASLMKNEESGSDLSVTDAKSEQKMAGQSLTLGRKRQLSMSPLAEKTIIESDCQIPKDSDSICTIQNCKKRLICAQEMGKTTFERETGNDPKSGQPQTGKEENKYQDRTESNMAAPSLSNTSDQSKAKRDSVASSNLVFDILNDQNLTEITSLTSTTYPTLVSLYSHSDLSTNFSDSHSDLSTNFTTTDQHWLGGDSEISAANSGKTMFNIQKQTTQAYSACSGDQFSTSYESIGQKVRWEVAHSPQVDSSLNPSIKINNSTAYSVSSSVSDNPIRVNGSMTPSDPPVRVDGSVTPSDPPVRVDGSVAPSDPPVRVNGSVAPSDPPVRVNGSVIPSDPPVRVDGSVLPSDPPVRIDGSVAPSDPPVRIDGSVTPSDPPVRVDSSVIPSDPPVRVDGSVLPSDPPVRVDGSVTPSDPPVRVDSSVTPSDPPVRVNGSVTSSDPPVRVNGSVTPSDPPVRVDGSVTPSDPPVRVNGSVTPSDPPVRVDGRVPPSDPPVRVDDSVTPSDSTIRDDGNITPSDEILVPHNSAQEKVPNVNPPSPQNKTPTITKPNLRSRQPRPQRYREDPPPPPKRKTFHSTQRAKVLKKKVLKTPPKKCNDCSVRNTGAPATEKPIIANEKATKETQKKRGRPKKESKSEKHDPTDIHKLLREISDTQSRQICTLIDDKITDLKSSIGIEIHNVKENVQKNTTAVSNLQSYQKSVDSKVGNLEKDVQKHSNILSNFEHSQSTLVSRIETLDGNLISLNEKTCDLDHKLDSIKQNQESEQTNRALSEQVLDVEHGLAAHIETIKGNMEEELSGAKQNQIYLENRLMDFTTEIHHQNIEMNAKIQSLKNDYDQLKALSETASDTFRTTSSFFSNSSSPSVSTDTSRENYQTFQNSNPQGSTPPNNGSPDSSFYMYGDTTRTLIVDGIKENAQENLKQIMLRCINEMGVPITPEDIVNVERIGRFSKNRKWPRPVKIILTDQTIRDQIYIFKRRLRFSVPFGALKINKEERKDVRVRAAKIKQAALKAKSLGHKVEIKADGRIRIDNVEYNTLTLSSIPERFMTEANEIRQPPLNTRRLSLLQKCTTNSGKAIMVGHSLQKTPLGLAFYSKNCFLSNFYRCSFYFKGESYTCSEQAYQGVKAKIYRDEQAFTDIKKTDSPALMKSIGGQVQTCEHWERMKLQVMEDILTAKFSQIKELYYSLLNTRPLELIEATLDEFWGAGAILGSIALEEGCWVGQNHLGKILMKVRNNLLQAIEKV